MKRKLMALASLAAVSVLALTGCTAPAERPEVTSIEFSQFQAIPDYDTNTYTVTDAAQIDALERILDEHNWTAEWLQSGESCHGSITTQLGITMDDGTLAQFEINNCDDSNEFVDELTDLVSSWH